MGEEGDGRQRKGRSDDKEKTPNAGSKSSNSNVEQQNSNHQHSLDHTTPARKPPTPTTKTRTPQRLAFRPRVVATTPQAQPSRDIDGVSGQTPTNATTDRNRAASPTMASQLEATTRNSSRSIRRPTPAGQGWPSQGAALTEHARKPTQHNTAQPNLSQPNPTQKAIPKQQIKSTFVTLDCGTGEGLRL